MRKAAFAVPVERKGQGRVSCGAILSDAPSPVGEGWGEGLCPIDRAVRPHPDAARPTSPTGEVCETPRRRLFSSLRAQRSNPTQPRSQALGGLLRLWLATTTGRRFAELSHGRVSCGDASPYVSAHRPSAGAYCPIRERAVSRRYWAPARRPVRQIGAWLGFDFSCYGNGWRPWERASRPAQAHYDCGRTAMSRILPPAPLTLAVEVALPVIRSTV
jgi:hypothetical protein